MDRKIFNDPQPARIYSRIPLYNMFKKKKQTFITSIRYKYYNIPNLLYIHVTITLNCRYNKFTCV